MTDNFVINPELPSYDVNGIKKLIPHRYPFLMIDRVANIVPAKSCLGVKNVTNNEPFFQGHFPDHPVMPGVLIVEGMAQAAGALVVHSMGESAYGKVVYFMTIDEARFRKPVFPGDVLLIYCEVERSRGNVWKFRGEARVNGQRVADATYSAMIMDEKGA
jgi:3-hydroxyacyl-[acyl-carrier-protein] dehydratase